jgi:uncharacterized protein YpmS
MKKWKLDRIISIATLLSSVVAIFLVLKKPAPVAPPQPLANAAANAQSFQTKVEQLEQPKEPGQPPAEVRLTSDEISAAIAQAAGAIPLNPTQTSGAAPTTAAPPTQSATTQPAPAVPNSVPSSPDAPFAAGTPDIKDYQVTFEGDIARGQFVTEIGGKDVYVTLAGHLGSQNGYATFDPTEFKVGDLSIPVSLVNDALQKKLNEQRDRLKLPDNVGGIKVENGELVMTQR